MFTAITSPTAIAVPSARVSVPEVGNASTVIVRVSPSTSTKDMSNEPAVSSVKLKELATRLGTSSIALTTKEKLAVLELVPSVAVKTKFPKVFNSEFAFSSEEKDILES